MKRYIFLFISLLFILFTACEDVIDVELDDEQLDLFAVEAKITTENNPIVFFYKVVNVAEVKEYPGISGATIFISDNEQPANSSQLIESDSKNGLYEVPVGQEFLGQIGREYTVTIEYEGVTITGTDQLSRVEPIDSIQVRASLRGDKRFLGVFTYGNETPGEGNYYKWDIYINNMLLNETEYMMFASDELVDGNYVESFEIFTDFHDTNEPEERKLKYMDSVFVKQTSISKQAYNFYYQMFDQSNSGGMFSVPPANIRGNFTSSDGKTVLGIFTAHDVSTSNEVLIDDAIENQLED